MLEVTNLTFKYTDKVILDNVNMRLFEHDHAVLVGQNGIGKSTLMNLICKNLIPDNGSVTWLPNIKYGYLDQHLKIEYDQSIENYLYDIYSDLFKLEEQMNNYYMELGTADPNDYEKLLNRANYIQEELERKDFYKIKVEVDNVLAGLSLDKLDLKNKLSTLSGGMKAKVFLAKLLLSKSDCILLDEPTNFLDKEHVLWLANYLKNFSKAYLVISHDEGFLRSIAGVVFELKNGSINRYNMDYDHFLEERNIRNAQYEKDYIAQQRYIKNTEEFIKKNIVRKSTTKRAQSRAKMLEKLDIMKKPTEETKININFKFSRELGEDVLVCDDLLIGYSFPILDPISFYVRRNEKIAITGFNGIGKSTLLKTLTGNLKAMGGSFKFCPSADIIYYAQEDTYPKLKPIDYVREFYPTYDNQKIRGMLARKNLKSDSMDKTMDVLSGGEQTKVRIAILEEIKGNLLILDEPTNHLDINAKKELYRAIDEFPGSVILVSHDQEFVDLVCDFEISLLDVRK